MSTINNAVKLFGRIAGDLRGQDITTKKGQMRMLHFSVACQRRGKDAGADFPRCVAYGKNAELIEKFFQKGALILVDGHIVTGSYTDRSGNKVYTTEVCVDEWGFGGSKSDSQPSGNGGSGTPSQQKEDSVNHDLDDFMNISDGQSDVLPFN